MKNIRDILKDRILLLDGATGTLIQKLGVDDSDFDNYSGCYEYLNYSTPDLIKKVHEMYLSAGADIIETNSFSCSTLSLKEYNLEGRSYELSKLSAELAKECTKKYSSDDKPRFVAGSVGPGSKVINVTGGVNFDELVNSFTPQIKGLLDGGCDLILFETFTDTSNLKAAITSFKNIGVDIPFMISVTIEKNGRMLSGQDIESLYYSIKHTNPLSIGINCGLGPKEAYKYVKKLSKISDFPVSVHANAGLPDENGNYNQSPDEFCSHIKKLSDYIHIAGGCCGTVPEHINKLYFRLKDIEPSKIKNKNTNAVSGLDTLIFDKRAVVISERANMSGSLRFRKLIRKAKFDKASEIVKKQVLSGAEIVDINLSDTESDEKDNIKKFYPVFLKQIKAPIMIDSSGHADTIETALKFLQGKGIINSINLENPERFKKVALLSKKYGAKLIVLPIEKEMAVTYEQKIKLIDKSYNLLANEYGVNKDDIIFDCLVFPLGTGDEEYYKCAEETFKSIEYIKRKYPESLCSLGVSNCSFGLPVQGRKALNSAYLHYALKSGLDTAIINPETRLEYKKLPKEERKICKEMIFNNNKESISRFIDFYSDKKKESVKESFESIYDKIEYMFLNGLKDGIEKTLDEALINEPPLDIINNRLMKYMKLIGEKFNAGKFSVIDLLQSAEVMKASVDYLKKFMESGESVKKRKFLIATVKGDVHDIGKNLVDIIFSNNGYEVIDIGVKCEAGDIIKAVREHKPDAVGLSGLLVKSAIEMINTAKEMKSAGINLPLFVGGAALSKKFCEQRIQPEYEGSVIYADDAVKGLELLNESYKEVGSLAKATTQDEKYENNQILVNEYSLQLVDDLSLDEVFSFINEKMLFGKHLGLKGTVDKSKKERAYKSVEKVKSLLDEKSIIEPKGVYKFFKVKRNGNGLNILNKENEVIEFFDLKTESNETISSYFSEEKIDTIALFCVTCGSSYKDFAKELKDKGEFSDSHIVNSITSESAEACAEIVHSKVRSEWCIEKSDITKEDVFKMNYQGRRYSPGYSSCPDMSIQKKIVNLLDAEKILGVSLTDSNMLVPEASTAGFIIHHKDAKYF